jgi:hypothetical protein
MIRGSKNSDFASEGEEILKEATLAQQLQPSAIAFDTLHQNYRPMLGLVKELIGVIPNCDPLLEIWPTGFRTYNLLVPNFLNLPFSLLGLGASKKEIGLAMYRASRVADCRYCSAHTCSFALRRGASAQALVGDRTSYETAVVAVAEGMSRIPCNLTPQDLIALRHHFSREDIEWIGLSVGLMGFLNKFMDAMGVELEAQSIAEVGALLSPTGWTPGQHARAGVLSSDGSALPPKDNLGTYFRVLRQIPSAIRLEQQWTAGVPDQWPDVGTFLESRTGHPFPILGKLRHKRAIRALATVLKDNLDPAQSRLGLSIKCLTAFVYAIAVANKPLAAEARMLAVRWAPELEENTFDALTLFASKPIGKEAAGVKQAIADFSAWPNFSEQTIAALILAHAASPSPAEITPAILGYVLPLIPPAAVVELVTWLSIQQLLHRLDCLLTLIDSTL